MKIKTDFVTNSSSTSYCMLGVSGIANMRLVAEALGVAYEEPCGFVEVDWLDLENAGWHNGFLGVGDVFITSDGNTLYEVGVELEHILKAGDIKWSEMQAYAAKVLSDFLGREVSEVKLLYGEAGDG
ncbi:MAG: hypothetical protein E3J82_01495 [Candidatus Thorarchaeota archaeon]|nr:MAG: hypothetical protein E3J82_01495 [Candidatus Thorarchaeota archaeon]